MTVDQQTSQDGVRAISPSRTDETRQLEAWQELEQSVASFLKDPSSEAEATFIRVFEHVAQEHPAGVRGVKHVRAVQHKRCGSYSQRYVARKWLEDDGTVVTLTTLRLLRDRIPQQLESRVKALPDRFPHGFAQFLRDEQPLFRAETARFLPLARQSIQEQLQALPQIAVEHLPQRLATLLDLLLAYRHCYRQNSESGSKALELIDAGDVDAMTAFLVTAAARSPLTTPEFLSVLRIAEATAQECGPQDKILRGRLINTGLNGNPGIWERWYVPFVRELSWRGLLPQLQEQYARRNSGKDARNGVAPPESASSPPTAGCDQPEPLESRTAFTGAYTDFETAIPIGTPPPPRLHILSGYLENVSLNSVLALSEAMRMAQANPDIPGHRQYVLRTLRQGKWTLIPRGKREPIFQKRPRVS